MNLTLAPHPSLSKKSPASKLFAAMAALALTSSLPVFAASLTWDGGDATFNGTFGGVGTWDTSTLNWSNASADQAWTDTTGTTDIAMFDGTAATVTVGSSLGALGLLFNTTGYTIATGTNTLTLGSSGIDASALSSGTTTISGKVALGSGQSWNVGSGATLATSAVISGANSLTKTGTGTLTLTGTNTYSSGTTISAGTVALTSNAVGFGTGSVAIGASGTANLTLTADMNIANVFTGTGTITVAGSTGSATFSNASGLNGFTGTLNVNTTGGKKVAVNTVGEKIGSGATVNITSAGTIYIATTTTSFDGVTFNVVGSGNTENLGAIRIESGSVIGATSSVVLGGNTSLGSNSGTGTINAAITESTASAVTKVGAQTLVLSGNNSYTGGTTINAGTLSVGHNNALGTGTVTFNGGTLANTTGVTLANNISTTSAIANLNASGGTMALNGNITGALGVSLTPTNKITLAGTNSFATTSANSFANLNVNAGAGGVDITGSTTVGTGSATNANGYLNMAGTTTLTVQSGGSLAVNGSAGIPGSIVGQNAAGTSTIAVNGGSLTIGGNTAFTLGNNVNTATGVLTISSGTATITAGSATLQNTQNFVALGRDNANGILNLDGGTLATGRQFVRDGSNGGTVGLGAATFNFNGGILQAQANQTSGNGWFETATSGNFQVVTTTVKSGGAKINTNGFTTNVNTVLAHDSGLGGTADGGLTKSGSGTLSLGAANTYTGATTISAGTLTLSGTAAINSSSGISVATGATFNNSGTVAVTSGLTLAEGSALAGTGSFTPGSTTMTANLADGFAAITAVSTLTKAGTLTFNLTNIAAGDYSLFSGGTPTGSFTGVSVASTALSTSDSNLTFTGTDGTWTYVFTNSTNNLTISAIPEPATYAAFAGALTLGAVIIRRRRSTTKSV